MSTETSKFRKFTKGERRKLLAAIRRQLKEGHGYHAMLPLLVAEGFSGPAGGELKRTHLTSMGARAGIRVRGRKVRASAAARSTETEQEPDETPLRGTDEEALFDLILSSDLPDGRKIALIKGLRGS